MFMGIRRAIVLAALTALLAVGSAQAGSVCTGSCYAAPAGSGALFVITGHGWGHGVGMSQYGAYGYAQHGWTYAKILAHYYPGTKLGKTATTSIRVLLADKQKTVKISSTVPFTVTDGNGARHTLAAGTFSIGTALQLPVDGGAPQPLTAPLTFAPGPGGPLTLGRAYRGRILLDVVDGKLRAINIVPLEQYLDGVVPAEMPSSWLPNALDAQAVASRSYALATRQLAAPFDVYSDTRSQMYLGIGAEQPVHHGRRHGDGRTGAPVQGRGRHHRLLLQLRRRDELQRGRLGRQADALSRVRPGPVRRDLAVPRLGSGARHRPDSRQGSPRRRYRGRRDHHAQPVRSRLPARRDHADADLDLPAPVHDGRERVPERPRTAVDLVRRGRPVARRAGAGPARASTARA